MPTVVPKKITIPATVEEAETALNGVEALLTAKEWQKAAIIAAFVRPKEGRPPKLTDTRQFLNVSQFVALGIAGLRTRETVSLYVNRWLDAHDGIHPEPGAQVMLPETPWPTEEGNLGSRVSADPVKAVEDVIKKHGPEALTKAAEASDAVAEATADAAEKADPVRNKVTKRAVKRNQDHEKNIKAKAKPLKDTADKAKDAYDKSDTGHTDPTLQTLVRLIMSVHEAEVVWALAGGSRSGDLVGALSELQAAVDTWRQRVTGTGTVEITENDRVWAEELGIDLGVAS